MAVLDPRHIQGHGPTRGDYAIDGMAPARERVYLRIPPTALDSLQTGVRSNGDRIVVKEDREAIQLTVLDGKRPSIDQRGSSILLHLTYQFDIIGIGTSSAYDFLARRLVADGRLDAVPDHAYFQRYQKRLRYWTGAGWTNTPAVNARWRAVADSARADSPVRSGRP